MLALLLLLAVGAPAISPDAGRPKTDLVELLNGDRITCEIEGLDKGRLSVKTDDMGNISIEWDNIRSVVSSVSYEVEVSTGLLYYGSLARGDSRVLLVVSGQGSTRLPFDTVVRIAPVEATFWARLDGSIDGGFSFNQSLAETQLTVDASLKYRRPKAVTQVSYSSSVTTQKDAEHQIRNDVALGTQRTFRPHWASMVFGQGQQNAQLSLNLRTVAGAGLARTVRQSVKTELYAFGGATYTNEQYEGESGRSVGEFMAGAQWSWFTYDNRQTNFTTTAYTFYGFVGETRVRAEVTAQFKTKIVGDLYWSANLSESYTSKPPSNKPKNDLTISATIGWSF